jgi:hypothetical protein
MSLKFLLQNIMILSKVGQIVLSRKGADNKLGLISTFHSISPKREHNSQVFLTFNSIVIFRKVKWRTFGLEMMF